MIFLINPKNLRNSVRLINAVLAFLLFACCITIYVVQAHKVVSHSVSSVVILYPNLLIGIFSRSFKKYDYIWYSGYARF